MSFRLCHYTIMAPLIGLKVDVDTLEGYLQGVPSLLRQMAEAGVKATFFFSVGPDRSGVAVRRFFTQRGFVSKMLRTRPLNKLSPSNMLYGTVLRAPLIVPADPALVRAVHEAGHEVGVHAWDHIGWHDRVGRMSAQQIRSWLEQAYDQLDEIIGQPVTRRTPGGMGPIRAASSGVTATRTSRPSPTADLSTAESARPPVACS
ncbi:MAG: polysaccharide deacetylase family protein, partial [Armatimonadota bacterium]